MPLRYIWAGPWELCLHELLMIMEKDSERGPWSQKSEQ